MERRQCDRLLIRKRFPPLCLVLAILGAVWSGCSIEKHYDLLSFFLDGVPDPNAPIDVKSGIFASNPWAIRVVHTPFKDRTCFECHRNPSDMLLTRDDSDICLSCHGEVVEQYPRMHGPVVTVDCLWCHDPHQSTIEHLLRDDSIVLCSQCHHQGFLGAVHSDDASFLEQDCVKCHSGHGGAVKYFLHEQENEEGAGTVESRSADEG